MKLSDEAKGRIKALFGRKMIIWYVASVALFLGHIDGIAWSAITGAILTANVVQKKFVK